MRAYIIAPLSKYESLYSLFRIKNGSPYFGGLSVPVYGLIFTE